MGCGASSERDSAETRDRYRGSLSRRGTQTLPPNFIHPKPKENRKNVEGTPIVNLEQRQGAYTMTRTRLPAKTRLSAELQAVGRGHATVVRGPPASPEHYIPRASICPDFAGRFVVNMTEAEAEYLRTTTVKKLQKAGKVTFKGSFSVEYVDDDPPEADVSIGVMSPRSSNRKRKMDSRLELAAVEESLNHLLSTLIEPRVRTTTFTDAGLRLIASFDEPVEGLALAPSEREVTVSLRFTGPKCRPKKRRPPLEGGGGGGSATAASPPLDSGGASESLRVPLSNADVFFHSKRTLQVLDVYTGAEVAAFKNPAIGPKARARVIPANPRRLLYYGEENLVVTASRGEVAVWDTVKRVRMRPLRGGHHFDELCVYGDISVSPCGRFLAVAGETSNYATGAVAVYTHLHQFLNFMDHCRRVTAVDFSPCSKYIASADERGEILVWGVSNGLWRARVQGHDRDVLSIVFTSNDTIITVCERFIRRWRLVPIEVRSPCGAPPDRMELDWERSVPSPIDAVRAEASGCVEEESSTDTGWGDHDTRRMSIFSDSRSLPMPSPASTMRGGRPSPRRRPSGLSAAAERYSVEPSPPPTPAGPTTGDITGIPPRADCGYALESAPSAFTGAVVAPCNVLVVMQDTTEVLVMDHTSGAILHSFHTKGIPSSVAPGRAMCAVGDSLGNVYALDIITKHELPGPANPIVTQSVQGPVPKATLVEAMC